MWNEELFKKHIVVKQVNIDSGQEVQFDSFAVSSGNELKLFRQLCLVKSLFSYHLNEKIFAYRVDLVPLSIDENKKTKTGAVIITFLVDNDGDGVFEDRYNSLRLPIVPDWVDNTKTNTSNNLAEHFDLVNER